MFKKWMGLLGFGCWCMSIVGDEDSGAPPADGGAPPADGGGVDSWFTGSIDPVALAGEGAEPERVTAISTKLTELGGVDQMAKSFFEQEKLLGRKGIIEPGEHATEEEKAAFNQQLAERIGMNVPAAAEDYSFELPESIKDQMPETFISDLKTKMHEKGFPDTLANEAFNMWVEQAQNDADGAAEALAVQMDATKTAVLSEWGAKGQERFDAGMEVATQLGIADGLKSSGLLAQPEFVKALDVMARSVERDHAFGNAGGAAGLEDRLAQLKADPRYMDQRASGRKELMTEIRQVQRQLTDRVS